MATPSFIRVPPDSTGKKVDMCQIDVGGDTVERQRVQLAGDASDAVAAITLSDGVPVSAAITTPTVSHSSVSSIAAGGNADIDSTQMPVSLTGKLSQVFVSGSVPFKAVVKTVQNNVESGPLITRIASLSTDIKLVSKRFITIAYSASAGFDGFRVTITNLDTSEAADFYSTFLYDVE